MYALNPSSQNLIAEAEQPEWTQPEEATSVQVTFDETESGPLGLAIFDDYPPMGPPRAFLQVENPNSGDIHN
mgnify:CR=1 FL=1